MKLHDLTPGQRFRVVGTESIWTYCKKSGDYAHVYDERGELHIFGTKADIELVGPKVCEACEG